MTRRPATHRRMAVVLAAWSLLFVTIAGRLVQLQATSANRFVELGRSQRIRTNVLPAPRGDLLDRNGAPLAMSVGRHRVVADPAAIQDPRADAARLAKILGQARATVRGLLTRDARYVVVARGVDEATADAVRRAQVAGITIEDEPARVNPAGSLARQVIGRVGVDGVGLSGLELVLDRRLQGRAGELLVERDPRGQEIAAGQRRVVPARAGTTFQLTIDRGLQYQVERLLSEQVVRTNAKRGTAVVMDPATGDVLAMANVVVDATGAVVPSTRNDAVVSVYEPGSVNKVITIAAALEDAVAGPDQTTGVPDRLQVADHLFSDDEPHKTMAWTMRDVLTHSSNVGTIQLARKLGKERIDHYLRAFGFGRPTGLDFPGEASGLLLPTAQWSGTSIGTVPIGQGIAVTPLQMLTAYNVLANDGVLAPARLVRATVDPTGRVRSLPVRGTSRVVSSRTAELLRSMLVDVVRSGTGRAAAVEGYDVAGKTGTARKPSETTRGYTEGAYIATFAGFVPAADPRVSAIVILDEPTPIYGGIVAAPLFSAIARFAVQHYRIPPVLGREGTVTASSPVVVVQSQPRTPIAADDRVIDTPPATRSTGSAARTSRPAAGVASSRTRSSEPPSSAGTSSAGTSSAGNASDERTTGTAASSQSSSASSSPTATRVPAAAAAPVPAAERTEGVRSAVDGSEPVRLRAGAPVTHVQSAPAP